MAWYRFAYEALLADGVRRPYLRLRLKVPGDPLVVPALIDSGADHSIFRGEVARSLDFDPAGFVSDQASGLGGRISTFCLRSGNLMAELVDVPGAEFALTAAFSEKLPVDLLGRSDFFRLFDVAFYGEEQEFQLRDWRTAR